MKAAYFTEIGAPANIRWGDLPAPALRDGELLVRVGAVSVNPIDTYIRGGLIPMSLLNPFIVGCDFAGTVEAMGAGAARFKPGDRVWGSNQGLLGRQGTFAEFIAVKEAFAYPVPDGVSDEEAASIALVGITAHLGLCQRARLASGETVFVSGGAGGVGSMVVQMAKAKGARVIASAGSEARAQICRQLGADIAINRCREDVLAAIREHTESGVDVYWETSRQPDFEKSVAVLRKNGRIIVMAGREARPVFPVGSFYVKSCSLLGFVMFDAPPEVQQQCARDICRWLASGKLKANIGQCFPLAETAAAHQLQEENTLRAAGSLHGKIVLLP